MAITVQRRHAPDAPEACATADRLSRVVLWTSAVIYAAGFFTAFILGPILEGQDPVVIHNELCVSFGIDELRVLSTEISFGDPTGLRAPASNVDSDAFLHRELKQVLQRRHCNADDSVAQVVLQHERRIGHQ